PPFPTRRSSDLGISWSSVLSRSALCCAASAPPPASASISTSDGRGGKGMTHRILAARLRRCLAFALALLMAAVLAMQATRPALADDKQKELENKKNQIQQ